MEEYDATKHTIVKVCNLIKESLIRRNTYNRYFYLGSDIFMILLYFYFSYILNYYTGIIGRLIDIGIICTFADFFLFPFINSYNSEKETIKLRENLMKLKELTANEREKIIEYFSYITLKWPFKKYYENICINTLYSKLKN